MKHLLFVISFLSVTVMSFAIELKTVLEWKYVDYVWDSPLQKQEAIDSGNYNASSVALYDVDMALDGRLFVTSVRKLGVPASLMTVTYKMGKGGPLLRPYPDWSWYKNHNDKNRCEGITSVHRVYIKDNYIFVLDCGKIGDDQVCDAQLLIFDLLTNKLVKRAIIPSNVANNRNGTGLLTTLTVFVPHCKDISDNAIVLIADTTGYGLVVFDTSNSIFCRIESDFMKPTNTTFNIEDEYFFVDDGIFGMTLIEEKLYYAPLAGEEIYKMQIPLQLECLLSKSEIDNMTELAATLSGQTGPIASKGRVIFYSNIPETSIMCADTSKEINSNNSEVIAQDSEKLQFTSGMKVVHAFKSSSLMMMTNRYKYVINDELDINEINFRILSINVEELKETKCFDSYDEKEKHKKFPKPPYKIGPKDKPLKDHKSKFENGFPEDYKDKFGCGPLKDHKDKSEGRPPKDRKDKPEGGLPKDQDKPKELPKNYKHGLKNELPIPSKKQE